VDDLVLHPAQPISTTTAMPIPQQQPLGFGAPGSKRRLETQRNGGTQFAVAPGMAFCQSAEFGKNGISIEQGAWLVDAKPEDI
jgi:hypothetical protein